MEDTHYTLQDIRLAGFGGEICNALQLPTHDKKVPCMDYVREIAKNPIAKAVKLADLRDNMDVGRLTVVDEAARKRLEKYKEAYHFLSGEWPG